MPYRDEFPDFDFDIPDVVTGEWDFEDVSWRHDACPSFVCDVFVLWIDFSDRQRRERPDEPQFVMVCEGETMLSTSAWEDVRAFVEDGKRHFPQHQPQEAT